LAKIEDIKGLHLFPREGKAQLTPTLCQILLTKEHHSPGPEDKDNQHHGIPELII